MSRPTPLSLPRFHVNALSPTLKPRAASVQGDATASGFAGARAEAESSAPAEPQVGDEEISAQALLPEIDTGVILNHLEAALSDLERSALSHSQKLVSEFVHAAFPRLCEAFLAEEVMRVSDDLVPADIASLILHIPDAYMPSFQRAISASPRLSERCELRPDQSHDAILVEVDWRTGGLQFDMDQFLESSLGRLTGLQPIQEGQDD